MGYLLICSTFSEGRKEEEEGMKEGEGEQGQEKVIFIFLWVSLSFLESFDLLLVIYTFTQQDLYNISK